MVSVTFYDAAKLSINDTFATEIPIALQDTKDSIGCIGMDKNGTSGFRPFVHLPYQRWYAELSST
jgi:hypothetical protein